MGKPKPKSRFAKWEALRIVLAPFIIPHPDTGKPVELTTLEYIRRHEPGAAHAIKDYHGGINAVRRKLGLPPKGVLTALLREVKKRRMLMPNARAK